MCRTGDAGRRRKEYPQSLVDYYCISLYAEFIFKHILFIIELPAPLRRNSDVAERQEGGNRGPPTAVRNNT